MLTSIHWNTLRAVMNRIIPSDDFPDAWDAGVGDYLARQFDGDLRGQVETYGFGLEALEAEAQAFAGKGFTVLDASTQDTILRRLEAGQVLTAWSAEPTHFFHMLIEHVMEGYYSDPGNGGNRDALAWRMIEFTGDE